MSIGDPYTYKAEYLDPMKTGVSQNILQEEQVEFDLEEGEKEAILNYRNLIKIGVQDAKPGSFLYRASPGLLERYKTMFSAEKVMNEDFVDVQGIDETRELLSHLEYTEKNCQENYDHNNRNTPDDALSFDELDDEESFLPTYVKEEAKVGSDSTKCWIFKICKVVKALEIPQEGILFEYLNYKLQKIPEITCILSENFISSDSSVIINNNDDIIDFKICINEKIYNTRFLKDKDSGFIHFESIEREQDNERYLEVRYDKENSCITSDEIKFLRQEFVVQPYPFKFGSIKERFEETFKDKCVNINQLQTYLYKIKGKPFLKKTEEELIADLKQIKTDDKSSFIVINKGIPTVALVQTSCMIENWFKYGSVLQIYSSVLDARFTRYQMHTLILSGLAENGQTLIFGVAFFSILCKESFEWIFKKLKEKYKDDGIFSSTLITSLDRELREATEMILGTSNMKRYKDASTNETGCTEISTLVDYYSIAKHLIQAISQNDSDKEDIDLIVRMVWKLFTQVERSEDFMVLKDQVIKKAFDLRLNSRTKTMLEDIFECQHCCSIARAKSVFTKGLHKIDKFIGASVIDKIFTIMKINSKKMKIQEFLLNIQHIGQAIFVRDSQDQDSGHQWLRQLLENGSTKEVYSSTRLNCLKRDASYYGISLALDQIAKSLGTEIDEVKRGKLFFIKDKKGEYCVERVSVNRIECNCSFNRTHDSFCSHIYSVLHHKGYEINNFECLNHQFKHCKTKYPSFFTVVRENKVAPKSRRSGDKAARKKEKALTEANLSKLGEETVQEKMRAREKDILRDTSNSLPNIDPKDISVKGKKRIVKEMMKGVENDDFISGTKLSDEDSKPNLQDELLEAVNYDKQDNVLDQSRAQECIKKVINYR